MYFFHTCATLKSLKNGNWKKLLFSFLFFVSVFVHIKTRSLAPLSCFVAWNVSVASAGVFVSLCRVTLNVRVRLRVCTAQTEISFYESSETSHNRRESTWAKKKKMTDSLVTREQSTNECDTTILQSINTEWGWWYALSWSHCCSTAVYVGPPALRVSPQNRIIAVVFAVTGCPFWLVKVLVMKLADVVFKLCKVKLYHADNTRGT